MSEVIFQKRSDFNNYVETGFQFSESKKKAESERKLIESLKKEVFGQPINLPDIDLDKDLQLRVEKLNKSTSELLKDGNQCQRECYNKLENYWTEKLRQRSDAILESINFQPDKEEIEDNTILAKEIVSNFQEVKQICTKEVINEQKKVLQKTENIKKVLLKRTTKKQSRMENIIDEEVAKKRRKKSMKQHPQLTQEG